MKIFSPTYKRPGKLSSHKVFDTTYVVCESQAKEYKKKQHDLNYWVVPDSAQGNLCRIRNYILDNCGERRVVLIDDDVMGFGTRQNLMITTYTKDQVDEWLEYAFDFMESMGVRFGGINPAGKTDFGAYRYFNPFSFRAYCGGPFQMHNDNACRYDEKLPLKEDYDMTLQVLAKYGYLIRFNMMWIENDFHTLPGGCAAYRSMDREKAQFELLERKWGSNIVHRDNSSDAKKGYDLNPILQIPNRC